MSRKLYSKFGADKPLTPAQYLAELMVSRQAAKNNLKLPTKFWSSPRWERDYKIQIRAANALLKLFEFDVILKVLNGDVGKRAFSLNGKWLIPYFKEAQNLEAMKQELEKPNDMPGVWGQSKAEPPNESVRPMFGKKSVTAKLRNL